MNTSTTPKNMKGRIWSQLCCSNSHLKHNCCWGSRFTSLLCIYNWYMNKGHYLSTKTLWKDASQWLLIFLEIISVCFSHILIPLEFVTMPSAINQSFYLSFKFIKTISVTEQPWSPMFFVQVKKKSRIKFQLVILPRKYPNGVNFP